MSSASPDPAHAHWEHFSHEADMGIRGFGASINEAFEQAALALTGVITDPFCVQAVEQVAVECEVDDTELLFVDWLNAVIFEMATRRMLFSRFQVEISGPRLHGKLWGEEAVPARHQPAVEVKGATFTCLRVAQEPNGQWVAQCVVDV